MADEWLSAEAARLGGIVTEGGGLLADFDELHGPGFDPAGLASPIVDFYERTAHLGLASQR